MAKSVIILVLVSVMIFWNLFSDETAEDYADKILSSFSDASLPARENSRDFFENQSLIVWGASTEDEDELDLTEMMAYNVVDFRIRKWLGQEDNVIDIIEDIDLTKDQIEQYNLILVGTQESNIWLRKLSPYLPFRIEIENEKILAAGMEFIGDEIGLAYRYPNPLNPSRMIWVITAPVYEAIRFIPKDDDYCLFELTDYSPNADRFKEIAQGDFSNKWELTILDLIDNEEIESGEDQEIEPGELKEYSAPGWINRGVMYEIFVRSFFDADGDGTGDLQGIIEKLDYLNDGDPSTDDDLGIELIWLMPVFESPSYHCYDVSDYYKIEQDYGDNEDFQELLREAHKRDIRVITDLVLNHCSSQHPFFQDAYGNPDSPYDNWFFFTNRSNTRAHNWQFRHREKDRAMLEPYMPAWNVNNPEVREYLFEMAKYWMDPDGDGDFSDGIDGFRCDYVKGPPHEFWKLFRQEVKDLNPEVLLLAENWEGMDSIVQSFDNEFDMAFDFPFQGSLTSVITSGISTDLKNLLQEQQRILPDHAVMNRFINNHDMNRIFTRLTEDQARLGLGILLLMNNMPMLYYGDEIGMMGQKDPYDEGIRRPMEWCADNSCQGMASWYPVWEKEPDGISVEEQTGDPGSILNYVKELIRLRAANPVIESGEVETIEIKIKQEGEYTDYRRAFAYLLSGNQEAVLIIANLHEDADLIIELPAGWNVKNAEQIFGDRIEIKKHKLGGKVLLPERSIVAYKFKE